MSKPDRKIYAAIAILVALATIVILYHPPPTHDINGDRLDAYMFENDNGDSVLLYVNRTTNAIELHFETFVSGPFPNLKPYPKVVIEITTIVDGKVTGKDETTFYNDHISKRYQIREGGEIEVRGLAVFSHKLFGLLGRDGLTSIEFFVPL